MIIPETRADGKPVTDKYIEAVNLNRKILTNAHMVQQDLYEMCTGLKQMRDGKLYKELGYKNFEEYCEQEVGIKRHMAYKYASIAEMENVESIQQIGVTKLSLLAALDEAERTELTDKTDIESASVRELKAEIDKLRQQNSEQAAEIVSYQESNESLSADNEELEATVAELRARPPKEIIIHSKEKIPDNSVSYDAFERECARYQTRIDELEHDKLMLERKAYAEKTELEEKLKEAANSGNADETMFNMRLGRLQEMLTDYHAFISQVKKNSTKIDFERRLYNYLGSFISKLTDNGRKALK